MLPPLVSLLALAALQAAQPHVEGDKTGEYLVVTIDSKHFDEHYRYVAHKAAAFHHAAAIDWDGQSCERLLAELRGRIPSNVLFIVRPEDLDINLHRRIISICNRVDDDPFADFCFGYLTARTPEGLEALWARTVALHEHGLASKAWVQSSITSGQKSMRYEEGNSGLRKDAGFTGPSL